MKKIVFLVAVILVVAGIGSASGTRIQTQNKNEKWVDMEMGKYLEQALEVVPVYETSYYSLTWKAEALFREVIIGFYPDLVKYQKGVSNRLYIILTRQATELEVKEKEIAFQLTLKPKVLTADIYPVVILDFEKETDMESFIKDIAAKEEKVVIKAHPEIRLNVTRIQRVYAEGLRFFLTSAVFFAAS